MSTTSKIVTNWKDVPAVWKNIKAPRPVNFTVSPYDKNFQSLIAPFVGQDALRPVMSGVFFDTTGAVVTNAHLLAHIAYKSSEFSGMYPTTYAEKRAEKSGDNAKELVEGNYPNYKAVVPKDPQYSYKFNAHKLLQYIEAAKEYANSVTHQIKFKFGENEVIGFNGNLLETGIKFLLKAEKSKDLWIHMNSSRNGVLLSYDKDLNIDEDTYVLVMPIFVSGDAVTEFFTTYGAYDEDFQKSFSVYFDFTDGEIHNADGSIAQYKESYEATGNNLPADLIALLTKYTARNPSRLPILGYVCVDSNGIRVTNLESSIVLKNDYGIPEGIYDIQNGAMVFEMGTSHEDFPSLPAVDPTPVLTMKTEALAFYIEKANRTKGDDDIRPIMSGVCLNIEDSIGNGEQANTYLVATDAHTLVTFNIEPDIKLKDKRFGQHVLSQTVQLTNFLRSCDAEEITLSLGKSSSSDNYYKIICGSMMFVGKLIDGKYPNYEAVIPKDSTRKIIVNTKELFKCMMSPEAVAFDKKYSKETYIEAQDNKLILVNRNSIVNGHRPGAAQPRETLDLCNIGVEVIIEEYQTNRYESKFLLMPIMNALSDDLNVSYTLMLRTISIVGQDTVTFYNTDKTHAYVCTASGLKYESAPTHKKASTKRVEKAVIEQSNKEAEQKAIEEAKAKASAEAKAIRDKEALDKKINQNLVDAPKAIIPIGTVDFIKLPKYIGIPDTTILGEVIAHSWHPKGKNYPNLKTKVTVPHYAISFRAKRATDKKYEDMIFTMPESLLERIDLNQIEDQSWIDGSKPEEPKVEIHVRFGSAQDEKPYWEQIVADSFDEAIEQAKGAVASYIKENSIKPEDWKVGEILSDNKIIGWIDSSAEYHEYKAQEEKPTDTPIKLTALRISEALENRKFSTPNSREAKIIDEATKLGYVRRLSTTQAEWTDEGAKHFGFDTKPGETPVILRTPAILTKDSSLEDIEKERQRLNLIVNNASDKLQAFVEDKTQASGLLDKGVNSMPEYRALKNAYDVAFKELRAFNQKYKPKFKGYKTKFDARSKEEYSQAIEEQRASLRKKQEDGLFQLYTLEKAGKESSPEYKKLSKEVDQIEKALEKFYNDYPLPKIGYDDTFATLDKVLYKGAEYKVTGKFETGQLGITKEDLIPTKTHPVNAHVFPSELVAVKKADTPTPAKTEPTITDYKDALAGAKVMLKLSSKEEAKDLQTYIDGLTTLLKLMK